MKRSRFLHLGVNFNGVPGTTVVDAYLNVIAPDWLRYSPCTWIIWTDLSVQELSDELKDPLKSDQYLILPVDLAAGAQGLFTPFVWDWLNRPRDGGWVPPPPRPRPIGGFDFGPRGALVSPFSNPKKSE